MPETEDLYEILQLHPSALQEVIDAAYQRLALLYHPATDPSPEAAERLGAIGKAYAVLGVPEKRTAYDQSREATKDAPPAQDEQPADTEPPKPRPRRRTRQRGLDYITIGSSKDDVSGIQGPPSRTGSMAGIGFEGETWEYGSGETVSIVSFNKAGRVEGWMNRGALEARIAPGPNTTTSESFSIGSHKDDVARLQGTPYRVSAPSPRTRAAMQEEREYQKFMREVDRDLGKPKNPEYYDPVGRFDADENRDLETWYFTGGIVELSIATGRVTGFENKDGTLKAQARWPERNTGWTGNDFFTLGSTMVDVFKVQGKPISRSKDPGGIEVWRYGRFSDVGFKSGRVLAWTNIGEDLKVRATPGPNVTTETQFSLGSHKDDVARLQGTPQSISAYRGPNGIGDFEFWSFNGGTIHFSSSGHVTDWENKDSSLRVRGIRPDPKLAAEFRSNVPKARGQGCGSLLAVLGLVTAAIVAAVFFA